MSLFVIADLHLSLSGDKPMDIFGGWKDHVNRLYDNWQSTVKPDDIVVVPGDISWAMGLEKSLNDFKFIEGLNGKKIILKGNHDYWWSTRTKVLNYLKDNGVESVDILHNNCFSYEGIGICGSRGWINDGSEPCDAKVIRREAMRLEKSILSALEQGLDPVVFLHYPPVFANITNPEMLDVLLKYKIKHCFYGHLHGASCNLAVRGSRYGIDFSLISSDYLQFKPLDITGIVQSSKK